MQPPDAALVERIAAIAGMLKSISLSWLTPSERDGSV